MTRTKNANYGLGEKVPDNLLAESERPSRVVYEDETPTVSETKKADSGDEETDSDRAFSHEAHATSRESGGCTDSEATFQKLKKDLQAVFRVLPRDMQELQLSNPQRASLLQDPSELQ